MSRPVWFSLRTTSISTAGSVNIGVNGSVGPVVLGTGTRELMFGLGARELGAAGGGASDWVEQMKSGRCIQARVRRA